MFLVSLALPSAFEGCCLPEPLMANELLTLGPVLPLPRPQFPHLSHAVTSFACDSAWKPLFSQACVLEGRAGSLLLAPPWVRLTKPFSSQRAPG
jgi:hypothetical protein